MVNDLQFQFSKSAGGSSKPFSFCCLFFVVCKAATSYASSYKTRDSHLPSCHLAQYRPVFFLFFFSVIFFPVSAANFVLRWTEKKVKKKKIHLPACLLISPPLSSFRGLWTVFYVIRHSFLYSLGCLMQ